MSQISLIGISWVHPDRGDVGCKKYIHICLVQIQVLNLRLLDSTAVFVLHFCDRKRKSITYSIKKVKHVEHKKTSPM